MSAYFSNLDLDRLLGLIREAGSQTMEVYKDLGKVKEKSDASPVTKADLDSEEVLIQGLADTGYSIVAEESGFHDKSSDYCWVVDPLDGTKDFIQETGEFAVMVGLLLRNQPVLGMIFAPALDKLWYAVKGRGSFLVQGGQKRSLSVSSTSKLRNYVMVRSRNHFSDTDRELADRLEIEDFLKLGSVGLKYGTLAEGEADISAYTTDSLGLWDCCAPQVVLEEAGGEVYNVEGTAPRYDLET
ncbi:MAG: 3'(2'),5'-bisphosphate nucleotidase CysQ, partial [Candidatus Acetothermia bacterium]